MPTALIVEDEPEANKLLAMLVQLRGYKTSSALNGRDALALVETHPPDVVFLDLMLPDINGYEVCGAIKARKSTALIPVIMVTARVTLENRIQSFSIGADQYVSKPYTPDQIFEALDDATDWRQHVDENATTGEIHFDSRDEGETLRQLSRLRSVLFATTPLDSVSVNCLTQSLQMLSDEADAWGQHHGTESVALLDYQNRADRVEITLKDISGWLSGDLRDPNERWSAVIAAGLFDEIATGLPGEPVTFVKHFDNGGPIAEIGI